LQGKLESLLDYAYYLAMPDTLKIIDVLKIVAGRVLACLEAVNRLAGGSEKPAHMGVMARAELPIGFDDGEVRYPLYESFGHSLWRAQECSLFMRHLSRIERPVLDLGCGDGAFAKATFGTLEIGADNDQGSLDAARASGVYNELVLAGSASLPLGDGSVASVVANSVLEHVYEIGPMLDEVRRVLRLGGRLYFTAPTAAYAEHLSRYFGPGLSNRINTDCHHVNLFSPEMWKSVLSRHGFEVESMIEYQPPEFTFWYRASRLVGMLGLVWKGAQSWAWERFRANAVAMVRDSINNTPPGQGANVFVIARRAG
jgi:SAM-dependent methyltransferase